MAAKIKPLLHSLLAPTQTCFLKDRSILHGFLYAQQVIQAVAKQNVPIATFKADIFKAFDMLDWDFLLKSLLARSFPMHWIQTVQHKILKGSSRIVVNSIAGKAISLKRSVRQGDPISPYLFNLSIDFLPRWMQRLNQLGFLSSPFPRCNPCLLYADDTLIFLQPNRTQILKTKLLFDMVGMISGLTINLFKSELCLTSAPFSTTQQLASVIQCKATTFSIKYLGLPLSDKRLTRADLHPIIEKVQSALASWKAALLSIGGRLVLTNAVLSFIPQYFMSIFLLPKWTMQRIDQIRRNFL